MLSTLGIWVPNKFVHISILENMWRLSLLRILTGLSCIERPILGDHPKAHVWKPPLFMKTGSFHWKAAIFTWKPYKSTNSRQIIQFHCVLGGGYVSWFHENCCFSWKVVVFTEKWQFSWKAAVFTKKQQFSLGNLINQLFKTNPSVSLCAGGRLCLMIPWKLPLFKKTATFHENRRFSHENRTKDHQLPEMVTPMFFVLSVISNRKSFWYITRRKLTTCNYTFNKILIAKNQAYLYGITKTFYCYHYQKVRLFCLKLLPKTDIGKRL